MDKYQNKYRSQTARAQWWNYANEGMYFITICTANRVHLFGKIENNKMNLSEIGIIAEREWNKSFDIRNELFCAVYVIMPNHIHAILRIENTAPPPTPPQSTGVAYRSPKSISSFVAGFKSAATKQINEFRKMPDSGVWQSRFHDHIIRNEGEYNRIKNYIVTNPEHWEKDTFSKNTKLGMQ